MNPLVIFDLTGPYAMFRKFYTNSSSLSYPFPPRSTLSGLIAGLMGYERDTYNEDFQPSKCKIALSVRTPTRRVMQTVNYLMTKQASGFDGSEGGTQIPIEWIYPAVPYESLQYRVYATHDDSDWLNRLDLLIRTETWVYPPYLGLTECLAQVRHIASVTDWRLKDSKSSVRLATVLPVEALEGLPSLIEGSQIIKERMPFVLNNQRQLEAIGDVLLERTGKGITASLNRPHFHVSYTDGQEILEEAGVFLE